MSAPGSVTRHGSQQHTLKSPTVAACNYETIGHLLVDQPNTTTSEHTVSPKVCCLTENSDVAQLFH